MVHCIDSFGAQDGEEFTLILEKKIFERLKKPSENSPQNASSITGDTDVGEELSSSMHTASR